MLIFVCGKSGSGKSTLSKFIADRLNFKYVDVDAVGHEFYTEPQNLDKVKALFGEEIFEKGNFNRKKLGEIIFRKEKMEEITKFNKMTLEYIERRLSNFLNQDAVIDWSQLPKTQLWNCNAIKILVKANDDNLRFEKILKRDNINEEYLKLREGASLDYNELDFNNIILNDYGEGFNKEMQKLVRAIRDRVTIKILGTQSPFSNKDHACPSYLIEKGGKKIILDCGSGSHRFFDMRNLENTNIFISHLHKDHFNDIANYQYSSLVMHRQNLLKDKINIFLPQIASPISQLIINESDAYCNYMEINENEKYQVGEFEIDFLKVYHTDSLDTFATRIKTENITIVYSADMSYRSKNEFVKFAQNADILICESSFIRSHGFPEICNHLTAYQAGTIAEEAKVKKLILTHLWGFEDIKNYIEEAKQAFDNVVVAKEEKEFYLL